MQPTPYPPGSPGKIQVLTERAEKGMPLFHPSDDGMAEIRALRYTRPTLRSNLLRRRFPREDADGVAINSVSLSESE
jgi:hypothetical protein